MCIKFIIIYAYELNQSSVTLALAINYRYYMFCLCASILLCAYTTQNINQIICNIRENSLTHVYVKNTFY